MTLDELSTERLAALRDETKAAYETLRDRRLALDLTRGKPSPEQLDLSTGLLDLDSRDLGPEALGEDLRNYGGVQGIPALRRIFGEVLQVPAEQLVAMGNSSLALMHDTLTHAVLFGFPDSPRPWGREPVAVLCPVPGYDRHFAVCEKLGIEMIPVPMTDHGPDMGAVETLAGSDPRVKGIWCVPTYSNPTGAVYSAETVRRLAAMPTAAPDFRILWDDAYAVHHLTEDQTRVPSVLALCEEHGHPDRPLVYGSTSKITFAGAGVAFFGGSRATVDWLLGHLGKRTIGPDKLNQARHTLFLRDIAGLHAHMARHRALLRPKFDLVERILRERLGSTGAATWSRPRGGYFISLDVPDGCARHAVRLADEAGIRLTPAGATFPYGKDPRDRTIRLAPTYPSLPDLETAVEGLTTCVLLAALERQLSRRPAPGTALRPVTS